jgi:hypothetical protein
MRIRFSIRTILLLTSLIAAACYWWIARPEMLANRFVRAVRAEDFAAANQQFTNPSDAVLARQRTGRKFAMRYPFGSGITVNHQDEPYDVDWKAEVGPRTWRDFFQGRRRIELSGSYLVATEMAHHTELYEIDATPFGLRQPA